MWVTAAVFVPPALLVFTLFVVLPIAESARYSLFNWNGYGVPKAFIGFRNYAQLLANPTFRQAALNNLLIIAASIGLQLPLALGMALLLARREIGTVAFRMIFFLPYVLADVAAGLIFRFIFDGDTGPISSLSQQFGFGPVYMLASPGPAFAALLIVIVWKYFGFHMMLYIAGLQGIDRSLYEAATMDGAKATQRFRHVTLPQLAPMLKLSVFFSIIGALQLFDMVIPLTGGGPFDRTHTMVSFLYSFGMGRMRIGFGSAVGVVLFTVSVLFAFGYNRLLLRHD
jgi:raffinose/stachyose/melibiose transport system permease protein